MVRKLYAIIGDPIDQVRSPEVFNRRFAHGGIDAQMLALHVRPGRLEAALAGLAAIENFGGAVITIPHKQVAAALAMERGHRVQVAGAANVLRPVAGGWHADLFDGEGFVAGLLAAGHAAAVDNAAVVGAGGAGLAIATALLDAGAGTVALHDVDAACAVAAVDRLSRRYPGRVLRRGPSRADTLAVNATPRGMQPEDPLPFDLQVLHPQAVVAEAIMKPPRTRLLELAARQGLATHEGRHMLDGQADAIWRFLDMDGASRSPDAR